MRPLIPCLAGAALLGCMPEEPPGELVGNYQVTGALLSNTCGSDALPASDPLNFAVQIREDGNTAYWIVDGPPGYFGDLSEDGTFSFTFRELINVSAQTKEPAYDDPEDFQNFGMEKPTPPPCRMEVRQSVSGTLSEPYALEDGTESWAALEADNDIEVTATSGDCSASMAENGGPFLALPCSANYTLEGQSAD